MNEKFNDTFNKSNVWLLSSWVCSFGSRKIRQNSCLWPRQFCTRPALRSQETRSGSTVDLFLIKNRIQGPRIIYHCNSFCNILMQFIIVGKWAFKRLININTPLPLWLFRYVRTTLNFANSVFHLILYIIRS